MTMTSLENVSTIDETSRGNLNSNMVMNPTRNTTSLTSNVAVNSERRNEDIPPSYDSSIPPKHFGWSPNVTTIIDLPMPQPTHQNDEKPGFSYPIMNIYPARILSSGGQSQFPSGPSTSQSLNQTPPRVIPITSSPTGLPFQWRNDNNRIVAAKPNPQKTYDKGQMVCILICIFYLAMICLIVKLALRR